jgi:hypothetical protein
MIRISKKKQATSAKSNQPSQISPVTTAQSQQPSHNSPVTTAQSKQPSQSSPVTTAQSKQPSQSSPVTAAQSKQPSQSSPVKAAQSKQPSHNSPVTTAQSQQPSHNSPVTSIHPKGFTDLINSQLNDTEIKLQQEINSNVTFRRFINTNLQLFINKYFEGYTVSDNYEYSNYIGLALYDMNHTRLQLEYIHDFISYYIITNKINIEKLTEVKKQIFNQQNTEQRDLIVNVVKTEFAILTRILNNKDLLEQCNIMNGKYKEGEAEQTDEFKELQNHQNALTTNIKTYTDFFNKNKNEVIFDKFFYLYTHFKKHTTKETPGINIFDDRNKQIYLTASSGDKYSLHTRLNNVKYNSTFNAPEKYTSRTRLSIRPTNKYLKYKMKYIALKKKLNL